MKIACLCNLNHMQYVFARYLADLGHEVTLFLVNEYPHFEPVCDGEALDSRIQYQRIPFNKEQFNDRNNPEWEVLRGFELYSCSEFGPAILATLNIKPWVFIPIGTDLTHYPFFRRSGRWIKSWEIPLMAFARAQYWGIKHAAHVFVNEGGDPLFEQTLAQYPLFGKRHFMSLPSLYIQDLPAKAEKNRKDVTDLMYYSRVEFTHPDSVHYKGSEILLGYLWEYHQRNPEALWTLHIPAYGSDVEAFKQLIDEKGLSEKVHWLPMDNRYHMLGKVSSMDLCFGNFGRAVHTYGSVLESIAMEVPFAHKGNEQQPYPSFKINHYKEFESMMQRIKSQDAKVKEMVQDAKEWFHLHCVEQPLTEVKIILQKGQKDHPKNKAISFKPVHKWLKWQAHFGEKWEHYFN